MATELQIINRALRQLGANSITALGDGSPEASVIDDLWEGVRQEFLADAAWRGATRQAELTERPDIPPEESGWSHWYDLDTVTPLPLDVQSVNRRPRTERLDVFWEIQTHDTDPTRVLLTNAASPILAVWSHDLDDAGLQNLERPTVAALAWQLSTAAAQNFGKTTQEMVTVANVAEQFTLKAKGVNSQQDKRRRVQQRQPLVDARRRGGRGRGGFGGF